MTIRNGVLVLMTALLVACGGSDGGEGNGNGGGCSGGPPNFDVTGIWDVDETASSSDSSCNDRNFYRLTLTQSGARVTASTDNGRSYTGTMCGSRIHADPFSYPEAGGETSVSRLTIDLSSATSATASAAWSWTDGFDSCSGTSTSTSTKR